MRTFIAVSLAALIAMTLFTPLIFGVSRGVKTASKIDAIYPLSFPDDFKWGVAVAAQPAVPRRGQAGPGGGDDHHDEEESIPEPENPSSPERSAATA